MALQRALESARSPRTRLFHDPFAPLFLTGSLRALASAARVPLLGRPAERLYDLFAGPGPRASAVARTRLIDDALSRALEARRQLVILGAGYDCRAYRLQSLANARVFEVDRPDTQAAKRERLARAMPMMPPHVAFVALDFETGDLAAALAEHGYRADQASVFLWEGVTNYLTSAAVDGTLAAVRRLSPPGSVLIFTYLDRAIIDRPDSFPEARRWLAGVRSAGEPWTFGLEPGEVAAYLAQRGFALQEDVSTADAGERYFRPRGRRERPASFYRVVIAGG
jgi:methyltransferase (TIGR00027 family)